MLIQKITQSFFFALVALTAFTITSCSTSHRTIADYQYFRNGGDTINVPQRATIIQEGDQLSIQVTSGTTNQEQTAIFNLPASSASGESQAGQVYQVNSAGNIIFPEIGNVKAGGLTISQLTALLTQKLTDYVKNPKLTIRFLQFNVNVLGEVKNPGTQKFQSDKVTVIDAIGSAGDLTDYGRRDNVTIIREINDKKVYYTIDLRSKNLFKSPVYILHPNDIVYVSPNQVKVKALNVDPEAERRVTTIVTFLSIVISLGTLIVLAKK